MAKKEQQQARGAATAFGTEAKNRTNSQVFGSAGGTDPSAYGTAGLAGTREAAVGRQNQTFEPTFQGYKEAQQTGGYDPGRLATVRGSVDQTATTGGYDPGVIEGMREKYSAAAPTGGFDQSQLQKLRDTGSEFAQTGGFDPATLANVNKGYQSFADTGGFTPEQEQAFRTRATRPVEATYNVLNAEAQRRRAATGGLGTGGDISQMARQLSQEASKASTGAEVDLASQERAGKLAGLGGLASTGADVAGKRISALGAQSGLESSVASGGRDILAQQQSLENQKAAGVRAGVGQQAGLESSVASGRLAGTAGMGNLFNASTGEVSDTGKQILAQFGLGDADQATQLSILQGLANSPGIFDNIMRVAGLGASGAGAYFGAQSRQP